MKTIYNLSPIMRTYKYNESRNKLYFLLVRLRVYVNSNRKSSFQRYLHTESDPKFMFQLISRN
jgi:hypothetical protein